MVSEAEVEKTVSLGPCIQGGNNSAAVAGVVVCL